MRTVVIVPTYNEAINLPLLATALLALDPPIDVLVVDDASPDGTGAIADTISAREPRFNVLHRDPPRGYSVSSIDGLSWALEHGYDAICTMDADLSHDPAMLRRLIEGTTTNDVTIGSRYVKGGGLAVEWGPVRRAVSRLGSAYARLMVGSPVRDCTSGFRCYRSEMLRSLPFSKIQSEGYSFLIELLALATRQGARVVEYPITYTDRQHGNSKISGHIVFEALWRTTLIGLKRLSK